MHIWTGSVQQGWSGSSKETHRMDDQRMVDRGGTQEEEPKRNGENNKNNVFEQSLVNENRETTVKKRCVTADTVLKRHQTLLKKI